MAKTTFPMYTLPVVLRPYVWQASKSIGCPPSYVVLPLLAALARVIGNKYTIRIKQDWKEPAVIWAAILASSSGQKSPAQDAALKFLTVLSDENFPSPDFTSDDISYASLRRLLPNQSDNDTSILYAADELVEVLASLGKGGQSSLKKGHWLSCWQAKSLTVHRYNETIKVRNANVSIAGGIQPGVFRDIMKKEKSFVDGGLCARFLLTYQPQWKGSPLTDFNVDQKVFAAVYKVFDKIHKSEANYDNGVVIPKPVYLIDESNKEFMAFQKGSLREANKLAPELQAAFRKLEAYAARFALIFHLVTAASKNTCFENFITVQNIRRGINLAKWFQGETRKVYQVMGESNEAAQRKALVKLIQANDGHLSVRELMRKSPLTYGDEPKATKALNDLLAAGLVQRIARPTTKRGGRPTQTYILA